MRVHPLLFAGFLLAVLAVLGAGAPAALADEVTPPTLGNGAAEPAVGDEVAEPAGTDEAPPPLFAGSDLLEQMPPEHRRKVIEAAKAARAAVSAAAETSVSAAAARQALAEGPGPNGMPTRLQLMAEARAASEEAARAATEARRTARLAEKTLQDALNAIDEYQEQGRDIELEEFVMPTKNAVVSVTKSHNTPWFGNWLAVELELKLAIVGQKGKRVGVSISFYEVANGEPLRSALRPYVDADGAVSVYSKAVPIPSDSDVYTSRLKVPYHAFPWPTKGPSYAVEARVTMLRLESNNTVTPLATGQTEFTILYERGCGCGPKDACPMGQAPGWVRNARYDWYKMWGMDEGLKPSDAGLPTGKGPGDRNEWFEWHRK